MDEQGGHGKLFVFGFFVDPDGKDFQKPVLLMPKFDRIHSENWRALPLLAINIAFSERNSGHVRVLLVHLGTSIGFGPECPSNINRLRNNIERSVLCLLV